MGGLVGGAAGRSARALPPGLRVALFALLVPARVGATAELPHLKLPEVQLGLNGPPTWVSEDKRQAAHKFAWADVHGRSIHLTYDVAQSERIPMVNMDTVPGLLEVSLLEDNTLCVLTFSTTHERQSLSVAIGSMLTGLAGWSSVSQVLALKVEGLSRKGETEIVLAVRPITSIADVYMNAKVRLEHTFLEADYAHTGTPAQKRNSIRPYVSQGEHGRRADIFDSLGEWLVGIARQVIEISLIKEVTQGLKLIVTNAVAIADFATKCTSADGCKFPDELDTKRDDGEPWFPYTRTLLDWNWNGYTDKPEKKCEFHFGHSMKAEYGDMKLGNMELGDAAVESDVQGVCTNCYGFARITVLLEFEVKAFELQNFLISASGDTGFAMDFALQGANLDWEYEKYIGTRYLPAISFAIVNVHCRIETQMPMFVGFKAGAETGFDLNYSTHARYHMKAGLVYKKNDVWRPFVNTALRLADADPPEFSDLFGDVNVQAFFRTEFRFNVGLGCPKDTPYPKQKADQLKDCAATMGGPIVPLTLFVEMTAGFAEEYPANANVSCPADEHPLNVHLGIHGGIGADIQLRILSGQALVNYTKEPVGLFAYKENLYSGCYSLPPQSRRLAEMSFASLYKGNMDDFRPGDVFSKCVWVPTNVQFPTSTSLGDLVGTALDLVGTASNGYANLKRCLAGEVGENCDNPLECGCCPNLGTGADVKVDKLQISIQLVKVKAAGAHRLYTMIATLSAFKDGSDQYASISQEVWEYRDTGVELNSVTRCSKEDCSEFAEQWVSEVQYNNQSTDDATLPSDWDVVISMSFHNRGMNLASQFGVNIPSDDVKNLIGLDHNVASIAIAAGPGCQGGAQNIRSCSIATIIPKLTQGNSRRRLASVESGYYKKELEAQCAENGPHNANHSLLSEELPVRASGGTAWEVIAGATAGGGVGIFCILGWIVYCWRKREGLKGTEGSDVQLSGT